MQQPYQDDWVFPGRDQDDDDDDDDDEGTDDYQTTSENESGWETGDADTTSSEEEEEESDDDDDDDDDYDAHIFSFAGNESGVMGGLAETGNLLGNPEDASLAVFPENFGGEGGGDTIHFYRDNQYPATTPIVYSNNGGGGEPQERILEIFEDEPRVSSATTTTTLDRIIARPLVQSPASSDNAGYGGGGLEPVPEDEFEDSSNARHSHSSSTRAIQGALFWMTRRRGLALMVCVILVLIIGVSVGLGVSKKKDADKLREQQQFSTTGAAIPTSIPTLVPTINGAFAPGGGGVASPSISLPPIGPSTVIVPVTNDGYVNMGGIILKDVEVTTSTTLLVQDGYHRTAAVSIIEFDTSSTLALSFMMDGWLTSAIVSLNVASADLQDFETTTLYAKAYPNDEQTDPEFDINRYGFGGLDFSTENGWIPLEVAALGPFQSSKVNIDITDFFQNQYLPNQDGGEWDNVKLLMAHDNSDGRANQGATVKFYSSEAAKQLQPQLQIELEPPGWIDSPAPSTSSSPSAGPTVSSAPTISMSPSAIPSAAPSLKPSSSWSPTYNPTASPAPTITSYPICSICGGLALVNPKAQLNLNNFRGGLFGRGDNGDATTCGSLQELGLKGDIPPKECQRYQAQVVDTCCEERGDSTNVDLYICDLCRGSNTAGDGIVNPDAMVAIPLVGEATRTCQQLQIQSDAGEIPESICGSIQPFTAAVCCDLVI